jgi:hypothetical protein
MRRKFELLMKDFWRALEHPAQDGSDLRVAAWGLMQFVPELVPDAAKVRQVLAFVRALRSSDARGRQVTEERLMEELSYLAGGCGKVLEDARCPRLTGFDMATAAPAELQPVLGVLRELHDFALACFQFKRPRDSFGGTRRARALEILGRVGLAVDLPEVVDMARQALKKAQSVEARQVVGFLQEYFVERDLPPDEEMIEELLSLAEATDSRSTAFNALNTLVETGVISEFEALDRMDDWKDKHR